MLPNSIIIFLILANVYLWGGYIPWEGGWHTSVGSSSWLFFRCMESHGKTRCVFTPPVLAPRSRTVGSLLRTPLAVKNGLKNCSITYR
jgi:hypothetical protein